MNEKFLTVINSLVETLDSVLIDHLGLMPPDQYDVTKRDGRVYVVGSFDPMMVGRNLKMYENRDTLRVIRKALGGLPVAFTQKKRFAYVVLASGGVSLPRSMNFPGFGEGDSFRLGVCLRGEVAPQANRLGHGLIGASPGMGKSNVLKLLVYQARAAGWKIYICDPDGHTFNPDVWNGMLAAPVASSPEDLQILIDRIYSEIADRAAMFRQVANGSIPPADLDAYNKIADPLPRIGLFVDEANSNLSNKRIFKSMADLLRRGRKWGLHIFLAGHEWHKDVVGGELSDLFQTRIGLSAANEEASTVVLRSRRWGRWVLGKPAGRGVIRITEYQPMQFYKITDEQEAEWLSGTVATLAPLSDEDRDLVQRSLDEAEGKMTIPLLVEWGMKEREARSLVESWELRGWLAKDPAQKNSRFITPKLAGLLSNGQTGQTASSTHIWSQTDVKLPQTPYVAGG